MVKHWLSGFEIEISERHFARIIHLFDLSSLQFAFNAHRDHLVTKITNQKALTAMENKVLKILNANIDNYLLNEEAYEALPEEIKIELSKGLSLEKKSLYIEEKAIATRSDSSASNDLASTSRINTQVSSSGLILPDQSLNQMQGKAFESSPIIIGQKNSYPQQEATDFRAFNASHFENSAGWPELHRRWRALPLGKKIALVNLDHLAPRTQAALLLATEDVHNKKDITYFKDKYPLKPEARSELFNNLVFEIDGVEGHLSIEIKLAEPKPVEEMLQTLRELSKKLAIQLNKNITNTQSREDYSLHLHLSDSQKSSFHQWDQFWIAYRNYVALKILNLNPKANAASISTNYETILLNLPRTTTRNEVFHPLYGKGLVRVINSNHIEARELYDSPEVVIKELNDLLKMDAIAATEKLQSQANELLEKNPNLFSIIAERNPYFLMEFVNTANAEKIEYLVKKAIRKHLDSDHHQGHALYLFLVTEALGFSISTKLKMAEFIFEVSSDIMLKEMVLQFLILPNWNKLSPDHPYFHALYENNKKFFQTSINKDFFKNTTFSNHIEFKLFILKKFIADVEKNPSDFLISQLKEISFKDFPHEVRNGKELKDLQIRINNLLKSYSYIKKTRTDIAKPASTTAMKCQSIFQN